jgi:subtilisin-like proprotein convertase family protein/subtilisin family serine protease
MAQKRSRKSATDKTQPPPLYTYQGGKKVLLEKAPDEFVIRSNADTLKRLGYDGAELTSPSSYKVTVDPAKLDQEMDKARAVTTAHHAYYLAGSDDEFLITDRIFVRFRTPPSRETLDNFRARYALVQRDQYSDRDFLFQLTVHTGMNPVKLVTKLVEEEKDLVENAEHDLNRRMNTYALALPTDPMYASQWHLHRHASGPDFDPRSSSRCEDAWRLLGSFGDSQVVVGLTDDGCKLDHADFSQDGKFTDWAYFNGSRLVRRGDPDADPKAMFQAGSNHGTSCAGVIASDVDGEFTVGAAPGVRLLPVKWESQGRGLFISDSKLQAALDFMADKVDVVSNSWGAPRQNLWSTTVTDRIAELARTGGRRKKGILFIWSAGNENTPLQHSAAMDVPYTSGWSVDANGNRSWVGVTKARDFVNNLVGIAGVLHVAAISSTARRSHYSNYGTGVLICAPSSNSHMYQRLTVPGRAIITTTGDSALTTDKFGGTSSAAPLVAAVAALVISADPNLAAYQVADLLKRTASKDLDPAAYARTPAWPGVDPDASWDVSPIPPFDAGAFQDIGSPDGSWSPWFGHGNVDALAAVTQAIALRGAAGNNLVRSSTPNRVIPDNRIGGISDTIEVLESGLARSIDVRVAIRHPWIGDLRVRLTSPGGGVVTLHNRAGARTADLRQVYSSSALPELAALVNTSVQGRWTLQVEDLAAADEGVLESWELTLAVTEAPIHFGEEPGAAIPDNDPAGLVRTLPVPPGHTIREVAVQVHIAHTAPAGLQIVLTPPAATPITLLAPGGAAAGDRIDGAWSSADTPPLAALRTHDAGGVWRLAVLDNAAGNQGKLEAWSIDITV